MDATWCSGPTAIEGDSEQRSEARPIITVVLVAYVNNGREIDSAVASLVA